MGKTVETATVLMDQEGGSSAQIFSLMPRLEARKKRQEQPSRAEAIRQLTQYAFTKARLGLEHSEDPEFEAITRLMWGAKAIICPDVAVDYLEPDYGVRDLSSSEVGRGLISRLVNSSSIPEIAQSPEVLPWLEELRSFVTNPSTFTPVASPPSPPPRLRLVQ